MSERQRPGASTVRHASPVRPAASAPPEALDASGIPAYAELHCLTHFSFQRGASSPEELVQRAWALGYTALAITDECSVAGVVRAWQALGELQRLQGAKKPAGVHAHAHTALPAGDDLAGARPPLRLIYGSEFRFENPAPPPAEGAAGVAMPGGAQTVGGASHGHGAKAMPELRDRQAPHATQAAPPDTLQPPSHAGTLVALARDLAGWGQLCRFITACRGAAGKGDYRLPPLAVALAALPGCERLWAPCRSQLQHGLKAPDFEAAGAGGDRAEGIFSSMTGILLELHGAADDPLWLHALQSLSAATGLPLVAAGDVQMHVRARKRLHDLLCAIRLGRPVQACGFALQPNAERHLRPRARLPDFYPPGALAATLAVAARCRFRLEALQYNYPQEALLPGLSPTQTLRRLTCEGAAERYPNGTPPAIVALIEKELRLIAECRYEMFFLTVHDIVRFARRRGILCQGRGSAANSVVCWCLGITAADPEKSHPLLERFISQARRHEPPDIDVDFEHERREEVIQYIYRRYGRHRAALAATVICWRTRSALRDAGRALGVDDRLIDACAKDHHGFDSVLALDRLSELAARVGATLEPARARLWLEMTGQLRGRPRHLSQHVGGFVLTETPLNRLVPVEPAAMGEADDGAHAQADDADAPGQWPPHAGRGAFAPGVTTVHDPVDAFDPSDASDPIEAALATWLPPRPALRQVIQWDKDDLEALGMLKVDVLALGMLTALRRCIELVRQRRGTDFTRYDIQSEDAATYDMIQRADTVGTFQIESRAQMSMLPRLRPTTFYDLVVQVAIVRPGPISGGMVHPYLQARERRRRGEAIIYERSSQEPPGQPPALAKALARTLGVPIFQEQVMEIAMIAAGFSATEADDLRRAMAAWKRKGGVHRHEQRLKAGMIGNGYSPEFAERIFRQILGFGEYGFPESHAYSFALIAYESAWLKCHEPEAFLAALLNSQPMGFYGPSQLVQDAERHDVTVLPPDVTASDWDCTLEKAPGGFAPWRADQHPWESDHNFDQPGQTSRLVHAARTAMETKASESARPAVRLGLRLVKGFGEAAAARIVQARAQAAFAHVADLARRAALDTRELDQLAAADALASLAGHRRQQAWEAVSPQVSRRSRAARPHPPWGGPVAGECGPHAPPLPRGALPPEGACPPWGGPAAGECGPHAPPLARGALPPEGARPPWGGPVTGDLLHHAPIHEAPLVWAAAPEGEEIVHDYAALGLSLRRHPLALLRDRLARRGVRTAAELAGLRPTRHVVACGLVIGRQRPATANDTIFVTLEDETGPVNVIVWKSVRTDRRQREALLRAHLLAVEGQWQRDAGSGGRVRHLIARRFHDLTPWLGRLAESTPSRDFH